MFATITIGHEAHSPSYTYECDNGNEGMALLTSLAKAKDYDIPFWLMPEPYNWTGHLYDNGFCIGMVEVHTG